VANDARTERKTTSGRLTDILLRNRVLNPETLSVAEQEAKAEGVRLEKHLVDNNIVSPTDMTLALSEYLQMPPMSLAHFKPNPVLMDVAPNELWTRHRMIPVARVGKGITVAMGDPFDIFALDELRSATGLDVTPVVASEKEVQRLLESSVSSGSGNLDMEEIMKAGEGDLDVTGQEEEGKQSLEEMMEIAADAPVVRMVNMLLIEAIRLRAMDIHIEPQEDYVRLRYRVDGVLIERPHIQKSLQNAIISRVKIMSDLDIGEQRIPQDGRFRIQALGKKIDVRVSILPTIFGGKVVLRLLDKNALFPDLASLGLDGHALDAMRYAIAQPHGIILVTGPTGSGKTTTLYSALQELNKPDINIVTCEDPVEYQLPGINQVKINTDVGLTFASALRAILRQDPDVVLIGEIRDAETCEIAIKAALTGHLVLSTLHTNDAAGAVTRLLDMGMEPFLLASSVILTQAQRLFRKLCPNCKKEVAPNKDLLKEYGVDPEFFKGTAIYGPQGCPKCHNTGFLGRGSIMEVLPIDDDIRVAILRQAVSAEIRDIAISKGMIPIIYGALNRVKEGLTSVETALRVAGSSE